MTFTTFSIIVNNSNSGHRGMKRSKRGELTASCGPGSSVGYSGHMILEQISVICEAIAREFHPEKIIVFGSMSNLIRTFFGPGPVDSDAL